MGKQLALKTTGGRSGGSQRPTLPTGSGQKHLLQAAGASGLGPGRREESLLVGKSPKSPRVAQERPLHPPGNTAQ